MRMRVSVVVGNPKPMSRTRGIAERFVEALLQSGTYECTVVELADMTEELYRWPSDRLDAAANVVADSDIAVMASPTYKATYTGLLKAFLDRYAAGGLAGVVAVPIHTGADRTHSMAPTFTLAPLLMELGAVVPGRGFYVPIPELDRLDELVEQMAAECADNVGRLARISAAFRPETVHSAG